MQKGKILVVDDEVYILHILDFSLGAEGFDVNTANNGEMAIAKAKQEQPNLIVLDIMMPVLDGYETLKRLKGDQDTKDIPVILLTAKGRDVDKRLGFEVVRGSTGRDGLQAIVEMVRRVRQEPGLCAGLAADGSRGPRVRVQGGVISLARLTGGVILPVTASASPSHSFTRAWDHTTLAAPFAKVQIVFGEPLEVPAKLDRREQERMRSEVDHRLRLLFGLT